MALTLKAAISADQTTIDVEGTDTLREGSFRQLGDETVVIRTARVQNLQPGETAWQRLSVDRGIENTEAVAHDAAVTMDTYSAAGGGGVTVDPGDGTPVPVTGFVAPGATIEGETATLTQGVTPPLEVVSEGAADENVLLVSGESGINQLRATGEFGLNSMSAEGASSYNEMAASGLDGHNDLTTTGANGLNVLASAATGTPLRLVRGSATANVLVGSADPSAGVAAAYVGSLYIRTTGQLWVKTDVADTAWTQLAFVP